MQAAIVASDFFGVFHYRYGKKGLSAYQEMLLTTVNKNGGNKAAIFFIVAF